MNLITIAYRSILQRGLASCMTMLSMALGVMMVISVISIHGLVSDSFRKNSAFGYNMVVGAKGGGLQLTLNSAFYLSQPIENIPYDYYLEFKSSEERDREYNSTSLQHTAYEACWEATATNAMLTAPTGVNGLAALLTQDVVKQSTAETWESDQFFVEKPGRPAIRSMEIGRPTQYGQLTRFAIPLCLGDYYGPFRVIGTTPDMLKLLKHGPETDQKYTFSQGRNFETYNADHGFFEAVVGATVARNQGIRVGDEIAPAHGAEDGEAHARTFTVVGILDPTGTPQDRAVFVNIEGFYLMENHAKPIEQEPSDDEASLFADQTTPEEETHVHDHHQEVEALPIEQREVTSVLVLTSEALYAIPLENTINEGNVAQAVFPVQEITKLFEVIVKPVQLMMLTLTVMICVVSGVSIMVSIYNSMSERKHEVAVMRALGAGRLTIMFIVLAESILLAMCGGALGWVLGHGLNLIASPYIEGLTGVEIGFFSLAPREIILIPALLCLAVLVGFLPSLAAYRTDVAKALSS